MAQKQPDPPDPGQAGGQEPSPELPAGTEVGGYVIDTKIGEGGMGEVYGAHHPRIGKRVAIKVLSRQYSTNASAVSRFEQEARLVNEIHHPNIVDVFQFGELPDKRSFFVMEWLDGESLSTRIDRGQVPTQEVIEILDVVCDALDAAHQSGIVHRDLKSDNIFLVTTRGKRTIKLLDFGLAKLSGRGDLTSVTRTRSGILVGTPAYMAPEQARGKAVDARTDIYALGVLSYKMLTGTLPFKADNAMDMIAQHLGAPRPSPDKLAPKTPPELSRLVVRMMSKNPDERPTLAEIREVFGRLRETRRFTVIGPRRSTLVLIGIMLFLAGVIAVGAIWLVQRKQSSSTTVASGTGSGSSGSTGSASSILTSPPAGSAAPLAGSANPDDDVEIQIHAEEIEPVGSAAPKAGSGAGSGSAHKKRRQKDAGIDDEVVEPEPPPPNKPGTILLSVQTASEIELDGKTISQSSKGGSYPVPPGHHEIKVKAPGRQPVTRSVDVEPGGTAVIRIDDDTGN